MGVVKMVQLTPALPELGTAQPQLVSWFNHLIGSKN
jgi:hypothetical protein